MLKLAASIAVILGLGIGLAHAAESPCQATSGRMLDHLDQGDYNGATTDFNDRMKAALSADRLSQLWATTTQKFGARGGRDPARLSQVKGYDVVTTSMHFGPHLIDARVVCDPDGKVAGFFIKPLD
ncbi:hypothetical protein ACVWWQ_000952 [Rhodanobacter sp. TND4EL1]